MAASPVREGTVAFTFPTLPAPAQTWYRVYGQLDPSNSSVVPLVALHGGPGIPHDYMVPLADLATSFGIPVILYDQIGNGQSTHYPEKKGDEAFWTIDLFVAELENLLQHLGISDRFDLLGHSWGGMLAAEFVIRRQPAGLRRLVVSDSPADVGRWIEAVNRLRGTLPAEVQDVLKKCEEEGRTDSEEYEQATMAFLTRFVCRLDPWPPELLSSLEWTTKKDPTVYLTMYAVSRVKVELGETADAQQARPIRVLHCRLVEKLEHPRLTAQDQDADSTDQRAVRRGAG